MKVRVCSDLHIEFMNYNKIERILERLVLPEMEDDKDTILVCSGDVGMFHKYSSTYKPFFNYISKRFKEVFVTAGNHSYYFSGFWDKEDVIWDNKKLPKNVHYLDNDYKIIDDVMFIGSCLWTDFRNVDPVAMWYAQKNMSDYELIKRTFYEDDPIYGKLINCVKIVPEDTVDRHKKSVAFLKQSLDFAKANGFKVFVYTHHLPSTLSISHNFRDSALNPAYASNLEELILDNDHIKYWSHGHTHDSQDYEIGSTRILCNPYGYHFEKVNKKYKPNLVVEI